MHLSGQLSDWSMNDLLQIMQVTKKTGSLDIEGDRRGRVHFREGRVTGAELTGVDGAHTGSDRDGVADILYVLASVGEGSFSVGAADGPELEDQRPGRHPADGEDQGLVNQPGRGHHQGDVEEDEEEQAQQRQDDLEPVAGRRPREVGRHASGGGRVERKGRIHG